MPVDKSSHAPALRDLSKGGSPPCFISDGHSVVQSKCSLTQTGGLARNRTGVHGFAIRCVTTPPRGLHLDAVALANRFHSDNSKTRCGGSFRMRTCHSVNDGKVGQASCCPLKYVIKRRSAAIQSCVHCPAPVWTMEPGDDQIAQDERI